METTSIVANYLIHFSETAISKLKLNQNVELRNSLNNACINFRHYSASIANQTLFCLFYGEKAKREEIVKKLFKSTGYFSFEFEDNISEQILPRFDEEEYQALANELLYQYVAANPEFLTVEANCHEYQHELDLLKECMHEHPVLLFRAVEMCKVVSHIEPIVSRSIGLLLSKNALCQRIGLEMIGHNFQHRLLLFPFAREIGLLLQAMHNAKEPSSLISPFTSWLNQHEGIDFDLNSFDKFIPDELPQYLLLSELENFLNGNSELISKLPSSDKLYLCLIQFKGNLSILLEKKEYLHLTKAIVTLLYATRTYWNAQEDFSMGDEESLYTLYKSVKNLESAKVSYNTALDYFILSCY